MHDSDNSKTIKIVSFILIFSVLVLFISIPVAVYGQTMERNTDYAIDKIDQMDGQNNFMPGKVKNQNMIQKIKSAF